MSLEMQLSGFLFLLIIIILILCEILGHGTISDLKSEVKLQKINEDPKKFKISFVLLIIEHLSIITLAIMLFVAFSPLNIILGVIWVIFRIGESSFQIYDKKNYWGLLNLAKQYSDASGVETNEFVNLGLSILKRKISIFTFSQILFSIGTLGYSLLFVIYEPVPVIIGWFGIVSSIIYGFGNGVKRVKPDFEVLGNVGGLLILIFELGLGVWLLFLS
ncbi:MAG: DUF4386 domain-containing protein [Candidatus Heimdallarchaeota archaeon]|nr:MAG: DUF4386 domain-containing protein [Candidatus Heimdallarchaeota archaeon]